MKEGHDKAFTELPEFSNTKKDGKDTTEEAVNTANATELDEGSRVKIKHNPHTRVAEEVKYSADDILDETIASTQDEIIQNVKTPDPDFQEELQKTRETLKKNFLVRLFDREHKAITFSVICAVLAALVLLVAPTLISKPYDPKAINPETGLTNQETEWNNFTDNIRSNIQILSTEGATEPESAVIKYFEELLEDYTGIADQMDIRVIWAEYYINFGKNEEALNVLKATNTEYNQPSDDNPDLPSYFERVSRYYRLLRDTYAILGEQAQAEETQRIYDAILDEKIRTAGLNLKTSQEASEQTEEK